MTLSEAAERLGVSVTRARTLLLKHLNPEKDKVPDKGKKERWEIPEKLVVRILEERAAETHEVKDEEDFQEAQEEEDPPQPPPEKRTPGLRLLILMGMILLLILLTSQTPEPQPDSRNWQ